MAGFFRGRRLRSSAVLREMVRETRLTRADLIQPYFVVEDDDENVVKPIGSMPGQAQLGLGALKKTVGEAVARGLKSVTLFGIPKEKDPVGSQGYAADGITQRAVTLLKETYPDLLVLTDVCLCEYTSHGHCGVLQGERVVNDATLELLAKVALSHARAGADIVAPSDMMDGRVAAIRQALDGSGFHELPILSYAVKYASAFYGPFREAAESAPAFGDRKSYQMDPANAREALLEAGADLAEGADMLMVKPAGPYLDILRSIRDRVSVPLCAYQVSGEYAMLKAAEERGWLDGPASALESLLAIKRAGADTIITYYAAELAEQLN